jgi:hypothetical protein
MLGGCAFSLGNVQPQAGKSADDMQLAMLVCEHQASIAANGGGAITTEGVLGATIIGLPAAISLDRSIQRQMFSSCMNAKGYEVREAE